MESSRNHDNANKVLHTFYIILYNAFVDSQNLKSGPSFELDNYCVVLFN